jgi:hypothetical protein
MPFVGVHPTNQHQYPVLADGHRHELTGMPNCAWWCEPGQLSLRQCDGWGSQGHDRRRPSGSQNDGDIVLVHPGALTDDLRRPLREFGGSGQGFGHSRRA